MTVGKLQATAGGKMLSFSGGKLMAECCGDVLPHISLTGDLSFYGVECDTDTDTEDAEVYNDGDDDSILTWARSLSLDASLVGKVTALPASGVLVKSDGETIVVSLDKRTLGAGTFTGLLTVSEQLLTGVADATLPITVQIDTYASFPTRMSAFFLVGAPTFILGANLNQGKTNWFGYCVAWPQVCGRLPDGIWSEMASSTAPNGPMEMWYNPAYAFESKYIYRVRNTSYFFSESTVSPWAGTPAWPYVWTRGDPEPATVVLA